jgi:CelD/BcsL family acetyltransferase involved in cellulose biosynthesis
MLAGVTNVQVVDRPEAVRSIWMGLEAEGLCLPFQHYKWVEQWCAMLAPMLRARPRIVLVSRSDSPVLILPFCIMRRGPVRSLEFMDGGVNDYNAPVLSGLAAQLDAPAFTALFRRILRALPPHDCVQLRKMPTEVGGAPNPLLWLSRRLCQEEVLGHRVPLDTFRELARGPLKEAAKKRRRLARSHRIELEVDGGDLAAFDALIGWKRSQYPGGLLDNERVVEFYRSLMQRGDLVRVFRICIDNTVVAAQYAVVSGRTCIGLITGYDPDWHEVSPGKLLTTGLLEYLHREGFVIFDAGRGSEAYKAEYGEAWQPLYRHRRAVTPVGMAFLVSYYIARRANAYYLLHRADRRAPSRRTAVNG